jgi:DNA polymerase-3 subunit delta
MNNACPFVVQVASGLDCRQLSLCADFISRCALDSLQISFDFAVDQAPQGMEAILFSAGETTALTCEGGKLVISAGSAEDAQAMGSFLAKQYPMMASHRVVILKEAQTMDKRELAKIERYLLSPVSTTVLVFVNNDKDFPQALTTKFDKTGAVFDSKKLKEEKLVSWIDSYVKQQGYTIESQASVMVADYLGNNLMKISNEISKLLINLKQKNIITTEDVSSHIGISKDYNVFELQKAISRLDYNKINKCVDYMAANPKENPLQVIFANLFTYFTKVLIVSQLEDKSASNIASVLKIPAFFTNDYVVASQNIPMRKVIANISIIREYDMKSKGVDASPFDQEGDLIKEFVYKLVH